MKYEFNLKNETNAIIHNGEVMESILTECEVPFVFVIPNLDYEDIIKAAIVNATKNCPELSDVCIKTPVQEEYFAGTGIYITTLDNIEELYEMYPQLNEVTIVQFTVRGELMTAITTEVRRTIGESDTGMCSMV